MEEELGTEKSHDDSRRRLVAGFKAEEFHQARKQPTSLGWKGWGISPLLKLLKGNKIISLGSMLDF